MVNNLEKVLKTEDGICAIDSREVAQMLGKTHSDLLKMIQGSGKNLGIIPVLTKGNFPLVDYFVESTYIDSKGEERKNYLVTKMGCELLGNKLQGEKGILFSASYVKRFNDMEKQMERNVYSYQIEDPVERALKWAEEMRKNQLLIAERDEIIEELSPLAKVARKRIDINGTVSITDVTKSFELKKGQLTTWAKMKGLIHKKLKEVNNSGDEYFKVVCPDGEHKNIAITEKGIGFIDKHIEEIKQSPCRFNIQEEN